MEKEKQKIKCVHFVGRSYRFIPRKAMSWPGLHQDHCVYRNDNEEYTDSAEKKEKQKIKHVYFVGEVIVLCDIG